MYKLGYYWRDIKDTETYADCDEGTLEKLIDEHINAWKTINYDLKTLSGVYIKNLDTGKEYIHKFTKPNDWEGFDLSVLEPKPEIRPRSIIEI